MASLREISQINPNTVVYDERTKQYHDIANRYRMVKKFIAEAMRAAVSSGAPTRGDETFVPQTTFDAFRKDVYFHISETARLTKIGLEELKKSLDYQSKETDRLRRIFNQADENRQENLIVRNDNRDIRNFSRRGSMSIGNILGLGAAGILGSFLASSLLMTPQQIREFGENIDNALGMLPDIQNVIENFNRINSVLQNILTFFTPGQNDPSTTNPASGDPRPPPAAPSAAPSAAPPPPRPPSLSTDANARAVAAANPPPGPLPENAGDRIAAARAAAAAQGTQANRAPGAAPGAAVRNYAEDYRRAQAARHERNEREIIERARGAPEIPEAVISRILFGPEALEQIRQMRAREGAYSGMSEPVIRQNIINMIDSTLQGADRQFIATAIRESIEDHPNLHGSAEVAARIVEYSDEAGSTRAAQNLYDIFFAREVIGERRARGANLVRHLDATRTQRSNQLRTRILNFNRRADISNRENIANRLTPNGAGNSVRVLPPIAMGANQPPSQSPAGQNSTPTVTPTPIQSANLDPTLEAMRRLMLTATT